MPVGDEMQEKAGNAHRRLASHRDGTEPQVTGCHLHNQRNKKEPDGQGATDNGNPLCRVEKAVLGMVSHAEDEVPRKAPQSQENDP